MGYWFWSWRSVKTPERTEPWWKQVFAYWLPLALAIVLLGPGEWYGHSLLRENFVPHTTPVYALGLGLCILGMIVAIWSRHLLGRNWSGSVQVKSDHELIESGPYRFVRHPIYGGLLLLFLGNAIMVGDWRGLLAVAIVFVSFWFKLKLEERWLTEHFGDTYRAYSRRTRALIPALL